MTQPVQNTTPDPWAAAGVATAQPVQQTPAQNYAPSGDGQGATGQAALAGAFAQAAAPVGNLLFTPQAVAPSLFNKTHGLGTELTGIVLSTPTDRQEQDFNAKKPKYFSRSKVGTGTSKATTTDPIDGPTGLPNDPIMGTHIELSTDYRMTTQEILAVGGSRDVSFAQRDDGKRVLVITGKQAYKAFFDAIEEANARGLGLTGYPSIVGKRITAQRVGQTPNQGGNPSWVWAYRIDAA